MALSEPQPVEGQQVDLQAVIDGLDEDFGPMPWEPLCKAIRSGDMQTVREGCFELRNKMTIPPKREAILCGSPDMLELLLQRDGFIDEDLVQTACDQRDRPSLRLLLDFGWPINHLIGGVCPLWYEIHDE